MLSVVDVELTPNPHALKFILNQRLLNFETRQFSCVEDAASDPLAKRIFEIEGVASVFYMDKFITIEKKKETDWGKIQRPFVTLLAGFDKASIPEEKLPEGADKEANELLKKINDTLNMKIRPALANDGGGLEILGLEGMTLKVRYQGACGTCPSAINGTLNAIEGLLRRDVNQQLHVVSA